VRQKLAGVFKGLADPETKTAVDHNVYQFRVQTAKPNTVYQVVSSLSSVEMLKEKIREALKQPDGGEGLKTYEMELAQLSEVSTAPTPPALGAPGIPTLSPGPAATLPSTNAPAGSRPLEAPSKTDAEKTPDKAGEKASDAPAEKSSDCLPQEVAPKAETAKSDSGKSEQEKAETAPAQPEKAQPEKAEPAQTEPPTTPPINTTPPSETTSPGAAEPPLPGVSIPPTPPAAPKVRAVAKVKFPGNPLTGSAVLDRLQSSSKAVLGREVQALPKNPNWDNKDNSTFEEWTIEIDGVTQEQAKKILDHMQQSLEDEVVWQTSNEIGSQVSADTRWRALGALAVSLLGIIAYVWFRFQRVAWGLAAVAALAHDALVMLTAIALSYWFAGALGFLGVEEFKISLSVVAAFLAILGYSVNDTIVIFDRLREIRGKSPVVTRQMLNDAVNQTLSRNIILAGITVTVVLILYAFGGPGIHAFAFAMMTGVISGCYTTLVIAAPLLLWLLNRGAVTSDAKSERRSGVALPGGTLPAGKH
jgi:SecD/SecF fusion protein